MDILYKHLAEVFLMSTNNLRSPGKNKVLAFFRWKGTLRGAMQISMLVQAVWLEALLFIPIRQYHNINFPIIREPCVSWSWQLSPFHYINSGTGKLVWMCVICFFLVLIKTQKYFCYGPVSSTSHWKEQSFFVQKHYGSSIFVVWL